MAENDDDSQKTEEPTHKRLTDSRNRGDVAQSREVSNWFMLFSAVVAVALFAPFSAEKFVAATYQFFERPHDIAINPQSLRHLLLDVAWTIAIAIAAPIGLFIVAAIAAPLVQYGLLFAPEKIKPTPNKISPIAGAKRMFSLRSLTELFKGLVKISLVAGVALVVIMPVFDKVALVPAMALPDSVAVLYDTMIRLLAGVVAVVTALALLDYFYQVYEHRKKLRMTQQEVRDEMRQAEGDPHVKARLRQIRTERARQRMMQAVPEADVVITNPTHYAVALRYRSDDMAAPEIVAMGQDLIALKIREIGQQAGVEIFEAPPLARALFAHGRIGQQIPSQLYYAVAQVLAFVFQLKNAREQGFEPPVRPDPYVAPNEVN